MTLPHFIFVFIRYCRKSLVKSGGFGKNTKKKGEGGNHIGGLSLEGREGEGVESSAHYGLTILCGWRLKG